MKCSSCGDPTQRCYATTADGIADGVIAVIADCLDLDSRDIQRWSRFLEDLGADSLAMVEMVLGVEEMFDIDIDDEDIDEGIRTVDQAIDLVARKALALRGP